MGISCCADNGHFKVFDSHARDIYGKVTLKELVVY